MINQNLWSKDNRWLIKRVGIYFNYNNIYYFDNRQSYFVPDQIATISPNLNYYFLYYKKYSKRRQHWSIIIHGYKNSVKIRSYIHKK